MSNKEFEIIFKLPNGNHNSDDIAESIYEAGFHDALIGVGNPESILVEIDVEDRNVEIGAKKIGNDLLKLFPLGSKIASIKAIIDEDDKKQEIVSFDSTSRNKSYGAMAAAG